MASASSITNTHTLTLQPGESFTLPPNSSLIFVSDSNSISTDCVTVPETTYKCGYFAYVNDDDNNSEHPMDEDHLQINKLYVGTNTYIIEELAFAPSVPALNTHVPDQALFTFTFFNRYGDYSKRQYKALYFKVVDTFFDDLRLELLERSGASGDEIVLFQLLPREIECDTYLPTV